MKLVNLKFIQQYGVKVFVLRTQYLPIFWLANLLEYTCAAKFELNETEIDSDTKKIKGIETYHFISVNRREAQSKQSSW